VRREDDRHPPLPKLSFDPVFLCDELTNFEGHLLSVSQGIASAEIR
jgi:hypothetical protein